jgi:polar amino acid transport system substrate-binding protein
MLDRTMLAFALCAALFGCSPVRAEVPAGYSMVLLTENFPPYNMAGNGKNFAQEDNIRGIAAELVREMYRRAGIAYSMTLRFPWDRIYKLALNNPGYGVFVTARLPEREHAFKWVGPLGPDDWIMLARADSPITLDNLEQARPYRIALRDQENAHKLLAGQIDLWATGDPAGRYLARLEGVGGLKTVLRFNSAELFLALNKDTPQEVVERLQQALDGMRQDGFVDQVFAEYL